MISDCHWWCRTPRSQICWSLIWSNHTTTSGRFLLISTLDLHFVAVFFFVSLFKKKKTPPEMKRILLFGWNGSTKKNIMFIQFILWIPNFLGIHWDLIRQNGVALKSVPHSGTLGLETLCCALSRMSSSILPGNFAKLAAEQKTLLNTWMINVDWVVLP